MGDLISDFFSHLYNCQVAGKKEVIVRPWSKLLEGILDTMKRHGYIKNYEVVKNIRGGFVRIELSGRINKCGAIRPRFPVKLEEMEKWEKRYLPAKDFGILILSTPKGVMSHLEAKEKHTGGVLLGYVY